MNSDALIAIENKRVRREKERDRGSGDIGREIHIYEEVGPCVQPKKRQPKGTRQLH